MFDGSCVTLNEIFQLIDELSVRICPWTRCYFCNKIEQFCFLFINTRWITMTIYIDDFARFLMIWSGRFLNIQYIDHYWLTFILLFLLFCDILPDAIGAQSCHLLDYLLEVIARLVFDNRVCRSFFLHRTPQKQKTTWCVSNIMNCVLPT